MVSHSVNPSLLFFFAYSLLLCPSALYIFTNAGSFHPIYSPPCDVFFLPSLLSFSVPSTLYFRFFSSECYFSLSEWLWLLHQSLPLLWLNLSLVSHLLSNGLSKHQILFHPSFLLFICSPLPGRSDSKERPVRINPKQLTNVCSQSAYTHENTCTYTLYIWYAFRMLHAHPPQKSLSTVFP